MDTIVRVFSDPVLRMDRADFNQNLVEASSIEQRFIFLNETGYLPAPKRLSTTGATVAQAALVTGAAAGLMVVGALLGGGTAIVRIPLFGRGNVDVTGLAVELRKFKPEADVIGVSLRTGWLTLRLGIDADNLPAESVVRLFLWIHQHSMTLLKFADSFGGQVVCVAQGLVLFSQHSKARQFSQHIANRCMHDSVVSAGRRVVTHPWVIDLEDETVTTCAGFWQLRRQLALDAKGMLPRLFQKRELPHRHTQDVDSSLYGGKSGHQS